VLVLPGGHPVSVVPLHPGSNSDNKSQTDFEREVAARFGLVPNFFRSAPDAPFVVRELWAFAKSAYLDTPIPSLLKERLFVYLSRFCEVRYCVTRHCGFLLGLGRASGDPSAPPMTVSQVIRLLRRPVPNDEVTAAALGRLEAITTPIDWPSPETTYDDDLFVCATLLFLQPARAVRVKRALHIALGGEKFELLVGFLTFIRSAHYWTLMHPELTLEDDVQALLREHEELAQMLAMDTEAGQCEMGVRLYEELESLRDLNERQELEKAKRALEESGRQKDLLMREVDHRVKNSLQIVSSLLYLQAKTAGPAASQFNDAAARVAAIAAVHQQLHEVDAIGTVALDRYIIDLCEQITAASSSVDQRRSLVVDANPLIISTDVAVPLGLIINELITNAIQHSRRVEGGSIRVLLKNDADMFSISVSDPGDGPAVDAQPASGLGTRIIDALARQIDATVTKESLAPGYKVTVAVSRFSGAARNVR
jgi:two-component sensor histidine kinase